MGGLILSSILRSLIVKIGADLSEFDKSMKKISKDLKKTGKSLSDGGAALTKGLTVPILGAAAGLGTLVGKSIESADEIKRLSDVTGLSAERVQELTYAGKNLGVEFDTIASAQAKLTKAMDTAKDGTGEQAEAFKALGISITDANGNLKNSKDIMSEAFTKLNSVGNETERDALAMQLFGKSAMELNPLIKAGGEELNRLTIEASKNGAVISGENITAMDNFGDSIDAVKSSLSGTVGTMVASLMPTLEKLIPILQDKIIPAIGSFVKSIADIILKFTNAPPGIQKFLLVVGGIVVAIGPVISVIGGIVTAVSGVIAAFGAASAAIAGGGGIMAALSALLGPVGLVLVAVAALAAAAYLIIKNWEPIKNFFKNLWNNVYGWCTTAWNNIKSFFSRLWEWFCEFPEKIIEIGKDIVIGLWEGISSGIAWLYNKISGFVTGVTDKIKDILGIHSPSKVMSDQVGKWIPAGISKGIIDYKHLVNDAMASIGTDVSMGVNVHGTMGNSALASGQPLSVNFNGPVYGMLDFEQRVKQIVKDTARDGGFRGVLANA
jgi:phage-related protein